MPKTKIDNADCDVMDIHIAARYLLISTDTLYKYATTGFVPAFKLGNRWRFRRVALDDWMIRLEAIAAAERAERGND